MNSTREAARRKESAFCAVRVFFHTEVSPGGRPCGRGADVPSSSFSSSFEQEVSLCERVGCFRNRATFLNTRCKLYQCGVALLCFHEGLFRQVIHVLHDQLANQADGLRARVEVDAFFSLFLLEGSLLESCGARYDRVSGFSIAVRIFGFQLVETPALLGSWVDENPPSWLRGHELPCWACKSSFLCGLSATSNSFIIAMKMMRWSTSPERFLCRGR